MKIIYERLLEHWKSNGIVVTKGNCEADRTIFYRLMVWIEPLFIAAVNYSQH
jgi:hypothetical protein